MACFLVRHRNDKQCWFFVGFIDEEIRSNLVKQLKELDFFVGVWTAVPIQQSWKKKWCK